MCQRCINKEFYCYGGKNLTPKSGYWRVDDFSSNFLKCPNQRACIGDEDPSFTDDLVDFDTKLPLGRCAIGYSGELCSICEEKFGRSEDYECSDCENSW